jgi:hypothetical protein
MEGIFKEQMERKRGKKIESFSGIPGKMCKVTFADPGN